MKPRIPLSIITLTGILVVYAFLFYYFDLGLLLSKTITSGGDMGSDYYPALYLRDNLLPNGKIIGWSPGWYAGFPLFQFYFPLSFLAMAVLSYAIPLQIAFKLVTVLGIFLLPVSPFFVFFTSLIFLLSKKNFRLRSVSLFKVYFLVFFLTAWWSLPMSSHLKYTT